MRKRGLSCCSNQSNPMFGKGYGRQRLVNVREMSACGKGSGQGDRRGLGMQRQRHQGLKRVGGWLKGLCPFLNRRSETK